MTKAKIYVARRLPDPVMAALRERFEVATPESPESPSRTNLLRGLRDADGAICTLTERIDAEALDQAPRLRIIANYAVGFNNIDLDAARRRGVAVTNTPDILTETTADLTWALLLAVARRIPEGHALVQCGEWTGWEACQLLGTDVYGKTLGVIGMGRIGRAVARRADGFAMPVLYASRDPRPIPQYPSWQCTSLNDVLERADFLTLHVPLTSETHHLIGRRELTGMKPTAFLINTSRGPVVDEEALVDALREGRLAGAGLDVYEREPNLHPGLLGVPNVVTLPHLGSATLATRVKMGMVCLENLTAVMEGREPPNRVA